MMYSLRRVVAQIGRSQTTVKRFILFSPAHFTRPFSNRANQFTKAATKTTTSKDVDWPKPSEIPFQVKVANSVNLIGRVDAPVQFQTSSDGKHWAGTVIVQHAASYSLWIPILFEGDLAHIASSHLKKDDHVHIAGQLTADPPAFDGIEGQANIQEFDIEEKITSSDFLAAKLGLTSWLPPSYTKMRIRMGPLSRMDDSWLFGSLALKLQNDKAQKKTMGCIVMVHSLNFIEPASQKWKFFVSKKHEAATVDHSVELSSSKKDGVSAPSPWRDLLDNPEQWRDYRSDKLKGLVKPRHPDFKRKDGNLPLWVNSAPDWVLSELEGVVCDKSTNVLNNQTQKSNHVKKSKVDDLWKDLVENPDKWWDNRLDKKSKKSPDFKHKETGKPLWLAYSPAWVTSQLPPVRSMVKSK